MPKYTYIVQTTGGIHKGKIEAEDVEDAKQEIELLYKGMGNQIIGWIGPYSEEELNDVNVDMIKENKIKLTESDIKQIVYESVKKLMEIGDSKKGQEALHALAARQKNKQEKLYKLGRDDNKMFHRHHDTLNFAHQAAMDKIHSGEEIEPGFEDAGTKAYDAYMKSHNPEDEKLRKSDFD